jgi:hypothetical protein
VTLQDLIAELRESRLSDNVEPYLWSDDELTRHINDAVRQVCIRQRSLVETQNTDICQIAVAAGQRLVKLHPSILAVRFAYPVGYPPNSDCQPKGITAKRLFRCQPFWDQDTTTTGPMEFWIPDYQTGYLALYPLPSAAFTLQLGVWRMPLDVEQMETADLQGEPVIAPHWHADLLDWAEYKAFSRPDADTEQLQKAESAAQTFTAKIGRLPSATEVLLWGVSPLVGTTAEFL